ncbi:helix-turn-helix transcriptional regulator [Dinoroseobacter sp. PD6]|uniref:helix-turn-helix domain-containing protein n=1 Tax=Dinoroseobacter sp. PD6 TaxID=3028384 RepID=UPI00237C2E98|nr:helix-turn-helix transcriptional regulator [Dinoroseobacter sp. PD6]MDD9718731.1 helix-turn-helix transcriptional regulator [Dinoroseobacter sp. PD6]
MAGTAHSPEYREFVALLVAARKDFGLSQAQLAIRLGKPPSFVAKYELVERRLDVLEFVIVCKAIGVDPVSVFKEVVLSLPDGSAL